MATKRPRNKRRTKKKSTTPRRRGFDVESHIVPIEEADPYVKLLVFARNKKGKTRFCASAPDVLLIDINEQGTKSARGFHGGKVIRVTEWAQLDAVYWYLKDGDHNFQSVAIDTVSQMAYMCMDRVLKEGHDRDPNKDPKAARRQDWGTAGKMMRDMLLRFRNLPMHVILTAQEKRITDDDGDIVEIVPNIPGQSRDAAMGAVDTIGRMYRTKVTVKKGKKRIKRWETRMLIGDHEDIPDLGDRMLVLDRIMRNPTVPKFIEAANTIPKEKE